MSQRKFPAIAFAFGLVCAITVLIPAAQAQTIEDRVANLDALAARVHELERNPHLRRDRLAGAALNLVALADRWAQIRPLLVQAALAQESDATASVTDGSAADAALAIAFAINSISNVTLSASRYTGFTQSETSGAWCGASVLVGFNDTGAEIKSLIAQSGVTAIGVASSTNKGGSFSYDGGPTPTNSFSQAVVGNPSLVCADANDFYYAAIWSDLLNNQSGVAFANSSDGGRSFSAPTVAIGKSSLTHFLAHDWLAIDRANPAQLYIAYLDYDFSGDICGTDAYAQPIPRYAIEVVTSGDSGQSWSATPTVVEEVCADENHPNLAVTAPQVAVGPSGEIYVAYEAMGENSGALTDREIRIAKSTNQAASFAAPVTVATVTPIGDGADLQGFVHAGEYPSIAIGRGKANLGFVYLSWANGAFSVPDSLSTTGQYGFADIMFAQSRDGGTSWSTPLRINNDPEGGAKPLSDQYAPAIGSDSKGRIGICFYDRRRDPNNFLMDRYCAASTNGGGSWNNIKITRTNFAPLVGQDLLVAPDYVGDYDTIATDGTGKYAGFIDSYASDAAGNPNVMTNHF